MSRLKFIIITSIIVFVGIAIIIKVDKNISTVHKQTVEIISPVDTLKIDYNNPPSYINPKNYHITYFNGKYLAKLPGGTEIGNFETIQEAQEQINDWARQSKARWLNGEDF